MIRSSTFTPPWWLANRHLQTVLPNSPLWPAPELDLRNEVLELPDGDFLRLEWLDGEGPIILLLHGLEGSSRSRYARRIMAALARAGYQAVLMSFRGCGGIPNRLPRSYHAGETSDLAYVIDQLHERRPGVPMGALGYSLGGNALLKYLGERGRDTVLSTAIAVSVPFDLAEACAAMSVGAGRWYQRLLLGRLRNSARRKFAVRKAPFDLSDGLAARDFVAFDGQITAPLHGFADAPDYYRKSSSRPFLARIRIPTLVVHAADDPFMTRAVIPRPDELSECVTLELSERGGHVGFIAGRAPWQLHSWLEGRVVAHFSDAFRKEGAAPGGTLVRNRVQARPWHRKTRAPTGSASAGGGPGR